MKAGFVHVLLFVSIAIAAVAFRHKVYTTPNEIDEFQTSIRGASAFLSPRSVVSFKAIDKPVELLIWSRDALFPTRIDRIEEKVQHDTTLFIMPVSAADSLSAEFLNRKKVLWHRADGKYEYYLLYGKN